MSQNGARDPTPYENFQKVFKARNVSNCAPHVIEHLKPDSKILDVGCSVGSITTELAQRCPNGHVIGIDINQESIDSASAEAKAMGISNVKFSVCDATNLSAYVDDSFDIAHAHQVMIHLPNPVEVLREMRRVVKPGGIIAIRDLADVHYYGATEAMAALQADIGMMLARSGADLRGGQKTHVLVHEAGFPWDKIRSGAAGWEYSSPESRKLFVSGLKGSSRAMGLKAGIRDEAFYDQVDRDYDDWEKNDAARVMALDGWVIGTK